MDVSNMATTITTLTLKNDNATATLTVKRDGDGSVYSTVTAGNKVITFGNGFVTRLVEALDALE